MEKLVEIKNLKKDFWTGGGTFKKKEAVRAVDDVSLYIKKREILGLVGESGCGKTTCGKVILRLIDPTEGSIHFEGNDITQLKQKEMRKFRRKMMIIYQDPFGSLDPDKVIEGIQKSYKKGRSKAMNRGPGGAGIGFHMVYELSSSLHIAVHQNEKTVICATLPLGKSLKETENLGKNLHVIKYNFKT